MYSYEMQQASFPRRPISPSSSEFTEKRSPPIYGKLTRENLKIFEQQQEREARERRLKKTIAQSEKPSPKSQVDGQQQVYVLDRVMDVDVVKEDDKFRCCCGCSHVYKAAWFVGILQAVFAFVALIVVIINYSRLGPNYLNHFVAVVCICVCYIVVLTFHFCGLQGKTACMLIPNLIIQFITMILLIVTSVLIGLNLTAANQSQMVIWAGWGPLYGELPKEAGLSLLAVGLVLIGACVLAAMLYIWFFYITLMCYRYLNDRKRRRHGLVYSGTSITGKTSSTATVQLPK